MQSDLWLAGLVLALVTLGCFVVVFAAIRQLAQWKCDLLAVAALGLLMLYIGEVWYRPWMVRLLPVSGLILLGNWLPPLAAVLAALVWRRLEGTGQRRIFVAGALVFTAGFAAIEPLLGHAPQCGNHWDQAGYCLQTTNNTCSPACAATLLQKHGIAATEQEMAELCLTRYGTNWQGLYRGLKLKTKGTPYDVQVVTGSPEELAQASSHGPMILSVGLDRFAKVDAAYTREYGWVPGVNHSVILQKFDQRHYAIIADPTQELGREMWTPDQLQLLWRGIAMRLVERKPAAINLAKR